MDRKNWLLGIGVVAASIMLLHSLIDLGQLVVMVVGQFDGTASGCPDTEWSLECLVNG